MKRLCYFLLLRTIVSIKSDEMPKINMVSREEWGARPPKLVEPMTTPVPYVIIHHSYTPKACSTTEECKTAMKTMQDMHQITNDWNDIGYSFAVGGDGNVYEGRGWFKVGAHAPKYNNISVGICVIGDWTEQLPPENQLNSVHTLISLGVEHGMIRNDYVLLGHRQVRETECPGERLFREISTWDHFSDGKEKAADSSLHSNKNRGVHNFFFLKHKS